MNERSRHPDQRASLPTSSSPSPATPSGESTPLNEPTLAWNGHATATRYERLDLLGRGGMGEVYRARQTELDRFVALKLILAERSSDPMFVARFRREALAMARLSHPNIVAIHDYGELDGRPFLAMEYISGTSLRVKLRRNSLSFAEAYSVALQLCEAIAYAHESGVVHRDLKPENVLVTDDGRVKVADFGLAKLADRSPFADLTAEGVVLGTLRYMAPEQLAGASEVDARADVYSLGVMLYELFTGALPVGRFAPPSQASATPRAFDAVVLRALEGDPQRRFPSGRELLESLAAAHGDGGREFASTGRRSADSCAAVPRSTGNLAASATRLVGREDERRWLLAQLSHHRLVTLTGPGGTGKTRLALQVGHDALPAHRDGVWFVSLAEVADPRRVAATIAGVLGLPEDHRDVRDILRAHLAERELLLILDNFEQLTAAAPTLGELLDACPQVRVLVTSRAPLRVAGEVELSVGPLALPRDDGAPSAMSLAGESPAVALFVERARSARADFRLTPENWRSVVEICRRLDGLPLAIELAAARIRLLSPDALAERLSSRLKLLTGGARDLPARQQTMRAAISWSYELLTPAQRTLLGCVAWLRGSFTLESAERLVECCDRRGGAPIPAGGEPITADDVLDAFTALVDHHLLRRAADDPQLRFAMYETIREFAGEQFQQVDAAARLRHAHADWSLQTTRLGEPQITGSTPQNRAAEWDAELPDFREAIQWCRGAGERPDDALRIIGELWYYWVLKGTAKEGIDEAAAALAHPHATPDTDVFSRALHALGTLLYLRDRPHEALQSLERALTIRRRLGAEDKVMATLGNLASVKRALGDFAGARRDLEEVIAYSRRVGDLRRVAVTLSNLGLLCQFQGRLDEAHAVVTESLAAYLQLQDDRGASRQRINQGRLAHMRGRYEEAQAAFTDASARCLAIGDESGRLNALLALANVQTSLQRYDEAQRLFAECESKLSADESLSRLASFYIARGYFRWKTRNVDGALADYRQALRRRLECDDVYGVGEVVLQIAEVFAAQARFADAARLLAAERDWRERMQYALSDDTLSDMERTWAQVRAELGEEQLRTLESDGRRLTLPQAAEIALS